MSNKSRGNYRPGLCMKFDCIWRDIKCYICIRHSEYENKKKEITIKNLSNCCQALVEVAGKTTHYYICTKCRKVCDIT